MDVESARDARAPAPAQLHGLEEERVDGVGLLAEAAHHKRPRPADDNLVQLFSTIFEADHSSMDYTTDQLWALTKDMDREFLLLVVEQVDAFRKKLLLCTRDSFITSYPTLLSGDARFNLSRRCTALMLRCDFLNGEIDEDMVQAVLEHMRAMESARAQKKNVAPLKGLHHSGTPLLRGFGRGKSTKGLGQWKTISGAETSTAITRQYSDDLLLSKLAPKLRCAVNVLDYVLPLHNKATMSALQSLVETNETPEEDSAVEKRARELVASCAEEDGVTDDAELERLWAELGTKLIVVLKTYGTLSQLLHKDMKRPCGNPIRGFDTDGLFIGDWLLPCVYVSNPVREGGNDLAQLHLGTEVLADIEPDDGVLFTGRQDHAGAGHLRLRAEVPKATINYRGRTHGYVACLVKWNGSRSVQDDQEIVEKQISWLRRIANNAYTSISTKSPEGW